MFSEEREMSDRAMQIAAKFFGVGWDRILQWIVVGYASAWLWLRPYTGEELGPIAWGIRMAESLAIGVPAWIAAIPAWLSDPARDWMLWALPFLASLAATSILVARRVVGPLLVSVTLLALCVQQWNSLMPVAITALWCAAFAFAALIVSGAQRIERSDREHDVHFIPGLIIADYVLGALSPVWLVLTAPALLLAGLVRGYGRGSETDPALDMLDEAMRSLRSDDTPLAQARAADVMMALVPALLLITASRRSRAANRLRATMREPLGATRLDRF